MTMRRQKLRTYRLMATTMGVYGVRDGEYVVFHHWFTWQARYPIGKMGK